MLNYIRAVIFSNFRPLLVLWVILLVSLLRTGPKKSLACLWFHGLRNICNGWCSVIWSVVCNLKWSGTATNVVLFQTAVRPMTRRSLLLFPCKTMVLLTDDSALLLWSMPTHAGRYVRWHGTMLLPISALWRVVMVIKSSKVFFFRSEITRFWRLWALSDL